MRFFSFFKKHHALSCIAAGLIYSLAFLQEWLFLFAYTGLYLFLNILFENGTITHPFRKTFAFFMGYMPVLYSWFAELYPFDGFDFSPAQGILIVILGILGISLYHSAVTALIFMLSSLIPKNKPLLLPPCTAGLFIISEWFLNLGPLKFSWGTVALTQIKVLPLLQNASLFGCYFITFIVVTFCGYMALFAQTGDRFALRAGTASLLVPIIIGTVICFVPIKNDKAIKAAAIQGNALSNEKWDSDRRQTIIDTNITLAEKAAENGAALVVLSESAFPVSFTSGGEIHTRLAAICGKYGCTIVTGALIHDTDGKHNAMIAIRPDGTLTNYYTKRNLVPFGETLPFKKVIDFVLGLFGATFDRVPYVEGNSADIIDIDGVRYGGVICFDSIFPWTVVDTTRSEANIIIIVTNDSWYNDAPAVKQHVWHAALRAVENGRYIVRAANTGISCFITPKGEIRSATKALVETATYDTVYTVETRTLYSYVGDVPLYLSLAGYALFAVMRIIKGFRNHGKNQTVR